KVVSGQDAETLDTVARVYEQVVTVGVHRASSIKVAEAAKVIENTQRDVNIALINELALIFNRLGIDTEEVLLAAGTKWNFLPFRPGLVGGHCIGVDPYYLCYKAQEIGYNPEMILAGRRINDGMGEVIADHLVKLMLKRAMPIAGSRILVMGLTFKENCPDLRNTRVIDVVREFEKYNATVDVYDPWVDPEEAQREYGVLPINELATGKYDAIVIAVGHRQFREMGADDIRALGRKNHVLYDIKHVLPAGETDGRL
ncbi:MAG: nucleotide sugar dehydrogenase, partial [Bradymonadaceae bacterium]